MAPLIILYSQGYRFDFKGKRVLHTGAFYFKTRPKGTLIYLNNQLVKKTDFVFGEALISDLLPGEYAIEIKKDGYSVWQKKLEIKEGLTSEAKNIFLAPQNIKFSQSLNGIEDFSFSPDNKKALLEKKGGNGYALSLFDLRSNSQLSILDQKDIAEKGEDVKDIKIWWSEDSKKILIKKIGKKESFFALGVEGKTAVISLGYIGDNILEVSFDPRDNNRIYFLQKTAGKNNLLFTDYIKKETPLVILENIINYQIQNDNLYWLNDKGYFFQSNLEGKETNKLNIQSFPLKDNYGYQIIIFNEKIILKENNDLYFFNEKSRALDKVLEGVIGLELSQDSKKIAFFTDYEIWVLFLEKIEDQPPREKGEKLFLTRFSEKIGNLFWWTDHYLVFNSGDSIKITEIDDRDKINIADLAEFKDSKIFWNKDNKKLYILSEKNLYFSDKTIR